MTPLLALASLALVALGGFFAAAESAIAMLPRSEIYDLASTSTRAGSLRRIAQDQVAHVTTCSFLRVFTQTSAAVSVTVMFGLLLGDHPLAVLPLSLAVMLVVAMLLVLISPRTLGRRRAADVLRFGAFPVAVFRIVFGPIVTLLSRTSGRLRPAGAHDSEYTEEQLLNLVDRANEHDVLEDDERELIHSVFEFGDTVVRAAMSPRTDMATLERDATIGDAMSAFFGNGYSRIPVVGESVDDVLGVIYLREVAKRYYEAPQGIDGEPITGLIRPAQFVPESMQISALLAQMQRLSNHMAIVIDEYGGVAGLVTMEDLIEELIGDISDESDHDESEAEELPDGSWRLSARLGIDEFEELFDVELEEEDVDTVGGLLIKELGSLPMSGATVEVAGVTLTAARVEGRGRRLMSVVARPTPALLAARTAFAQLTQPDTRRRKEKEGTA